MRGLTEEHSVEELTDELRAIGGEIDSWKATYDVASLEELRRTIGDDTLSEDERRDRHECIEEWEYTVQMREALQLAIGLHQSLTRLDVDPRLDTSESDTLPQEG